MILKISLRAKAGVPKTLVKQKNLLYSLSLRTRLCWLSLAGNSVICVLFLDFLRFAIRRKSFSVLLKIPYVKIQIFRDRSFAWFVNYFFAKFLEILTTGSLEIGKFLQKQSVSIFWATAHALHLTGFFWYWKIRELLGSLHRYLFWHTFVIKD